MKCLLHKPNTLHIIKSNYGNIFGGFISSPWKNNGTQVKDQKAFIFSYDHKRKFEAIPNKNTIYFPDPEAAHIITLFGSFLSPVLQINEEG